MKQRAVVMIVVVCLAVGLAAPAGAGYIFRDFDFDYCDWRSYAVSGILGSYADTWTEDQNGNCKYLDADTKYRNGANVFTKWCSSQLTDWMTCRKDFFSHEQSKSQAQSWETDRWQTSGWWG